MPQFFSENMDKKQKAERFGCALMIALAALYAFVCTPVYYVANSNVLLSSFTFGWDFVNDAVQYLYYWVSFAFLIFFAARYTFRSIRCLLVTFSVCSAGRYFFALIVILIIDKDWESFGYEMKQILEITLGDLLMMGLAVLLVYLILVKRAQSKDALKSIQSASVYHIHKPLMGCMLAVAFIPAVIRIVSRVWYDLFLGAPQGKADLISMVVYYTGDVLCGIIGYLVIYLIVLKLFYKDAEVYKTEDASGKR